MSDQLVQVEPAGLFQRTVGNAVADRSQVWMAQNDNQTTPSYYSKSKKRRTIRP
jgi:hypothetical protein